MRLDHEPVYIPGLGRRRRVLPVKTQILVAIACLAIVLFGESGLHGFFWLIAHLGEITVHFLQWIGVAEG